MQLQTILLVFQDACDTGRLAVTNRFLDKSLVPVTNQVLDKSLLGQINLTQLHMTAPMRVLWLYQQHLLFWL
jgi:hypothetical protein